MRALTTLRLTSRRSRTGLGTLASLGLLLSCGPKEPPAPAAAPPPAEPAHRVAAPGPLSPRAFQVPVPRREKLSTGLPVIVVENHEVPLVYVRLVINRGSFTDPSGMPGLASVTMDMLNEGAGDYDAAGLSSALEKLGATLTTSSGLDGAEISLSVLGRNLEPALDLMTTVLLEPTFPKADWKLLQRKRLQNLEAARQDPSKISSRAFGHLMYGDAYAGHLTTAESYSSIKVQDMRAWYRENVVPQDSMVLVGGDISLAEITPLLEARLSGWEKTDAARAKLPTADGLPSHDATTLYLIDKTDAPQSVVKVGAFVGDRHASDYTAFVLANRAIGGNFSSRINMNLREDKGWTYGARSYTRHNHLPGLWRVGTSVVTDHTADAVSEILRELAQSRGNTPISADELEAARGGLLGSWPLDFERPGHLLDQTRGIWRYQLPHDWISGFPDRVRGADLEDVQAAWSAHIDTRSLVILVVGDEGTIGPALAELDLPIVRLSPDGAPIE